MAADEVARSRRRPPGGTSPYIPAKIRQLCSLVLYYRPRERRRDRCLIRRVQPEPSPRDTATDKIEERKKATGIHWRMVAVRLPASIVFPSPWSTGLTALAPLPPPLLHHLHLRHCRPLHTTPQRHSFPLLKRGQVPLFSQTYQDDELRFSSFFLGSPIQIDTKPPKKKSSKTTQPTQNFSEHKTCPQQIRAVLPRHDEFMMPLARTEDEPRVETSTSNKSACSIVY